MLDYLINDIRDTEYLIDYATIYSKIDVLNWFLNSGLILTYTCRGIDNTKHVDVLNWWLNSDLKMKYSETSMFIASKYVYIDVLNWWLNSGLRIK